MTDARLPDPATVVLAGAAGSGKSTWAAERFRTAEVVSSMRIRAASAAAQPTWMRQWTPSSRCSIKSPLHGSKRR